MYFTSTSIQGKIPKKDAVLKVIQRCRNSLQAPPQLSDRASIIIPEIYQKYETSHDNLEQFLLWDSGQQGDDKFFIFGKQSSKG